MVPVRLDALNFGVALAILGCAASAPAPPRRESAVTHANARATSPATSSDDAAESEPIDGGENDSAPSPGGPATVAPSPSARPQHAEAPPRLTTEAIATLIWPHAKAEGRFLGSLRFGQSVGLRSIELVPGEGCSGGFYAIQPRGYVCRDRTVTLAPNARLAALGGATAPKSVGSPYRYALSNGAPMYNRLPKPQEQARSERILGRPGAFRPLVKALAAHADLATLDPIPSERPPPSFVADGDMLVPGRRDLVNQLIPLGSMLSFSAAYDVNGRTFLLSSDMTLVPADRVRPYRASEFHGTALGAGVVLPIAWARKTARVKWQRRGAGLERADATWPARSFVRLTGATLEQNGEKFWETADADPAHPGDKLWVAQSDATISVAEDKVPFGVKPAQKWIVVRISQGTLVAYQGLTPIYATLVSPGAGGVPARGADPVQSRATPLGTFFVTFKDRAATMSPDKDPDNRTFWIADVPYTQYFDPPFALHAAYWHERFGEPTSAGCINLSPIDAEALFVWSDPQVPDDWEGATGAGAIENGATTAVVVRP